MNIKENIKIELEQTIEDKDNPKVTNDIFLFIILPPINQSFYLIIFLKLKLILQI